MLNLRSLLEVNLAASSYRAEHSEKGGENEGAGRAVRKGEWDEREASSSDNVTSERGYEG